MSRVNEQLQKKATGLDVKLHENFSGGVLDLSADSPQGKIFKASGCHSIVVSEFDVNERGQRDSVRQGMLDQLNAGLDDCDEPDCEICTEEA